MQLVFTVNLAYPLRSTVIPRMSDELLTTVEVAQMLRVDRGTVTRWARLGQIPYVRLPGGGYRFRREDVEHVLRKGQEAES